MIFLNSRLTEQKISLIVSAPLWPVYKESSLVRLTQGQLSQIQLSTQTSVLLIILGVSRSEQSDPEEREKENSYF